MSKIGSISASVCGATGLTHQTSHHSDCNNITMQIISWSGIVNLQNEMQRAGRITALLNKLDPEKGSAGWVGYKSARMLGPGCFGGAFKVEKVHPELL